MKEALRVSVLAAFMLCLSGLAAPAQDDSEKEIERYRAMISDPLSNPGYLAVDRVIINDDGVMHFWCDGPGTTAYNGNLYWYEAPAHDKFWLVPWDLDESFDGYPAGRISPEWSKPAACSCSGSGTSAASRCRW